MSRAGKTVENATGAAVKVCPVAVAGKLEGGRLKMFVLARNQPAALPRGNILRAFGRSAVMSVVVAGFVAVSSAPAQAGFGYFTLDEAGAGSYHEEQLAKELATSNLGDVLGSDDIPAGSSSVDSTSITFGAISQVNNATPPSDPAPPLLIPVPTAISSGLCGLIVLALVATPRWLRRRLFG